MLLEIAKVVQFFGIRKCRKETGKRDWRGRFFLRLVYVSFTCRLRVVYVSFTSFLRNVGVRGIKKQPMLAACGREVLMPEWHSG